MCLAAGTASFIGAAIQTLLHLVAGGGCLSLRGAFQVALYSKSSSLKRQSTAPRVWMSRCLARSRTNYLLAVALC
ncbi:hypothetical protein BKA80DRAFT_262156 [Phyllosticta citrichinensis]